jgi:DNA-binding NarL/FixJ family response regulator
MIQAITLIIADDHPLFREGIRKIVAQDSSLHLLDEAKNGEEALRSIQQKTPDVAMLDIRMPKMSGLAVAKEIFHLRYNTEIIFLTNYDDDELFDAAMELGVRGYLLKECLPNDMLNAIRTVAQKKYFIDPALSKRVDKKNVNYIQKEKDAPPLEVLTEMERKILRFVADGKTSKEIAHELFISVRTVDNHRANIANKLNLHGSFMFLKFALENKRNL